MKDYKVLFADLDGTLITTKSGNTFPVGIWDMQLIDTVINRISEMEGLEMIVIVSNQGGIESGHLKEEDFIVKAEYVAKCIEGITGVKVFYTYCKTNSKTDKNRKPNSGMVDSYIESFNLNKEDCLMIGDASGLDGQFSDSDLKCAEAAGINYMDVDLFSLIC